MKNKHAEETVAILVRMMAELPNMRGSSIRIVNKSSGLDLVRNRERHSSPLVLSLISYCDWLQVDPCFFLTIVILVQKGEIIEAKGLDILKEPNPIQQAFKVGQTFMFSKIKEALQNQ